MNQRKINELIDSLLDGEIGEAEFSTLQAALLKDDGLRREYLDRLTLSVLLDEEAQHWKQEPSLPSGAPTATGSDTWWKWQLLGGSGLVLGIAMLLSFALSTPKLATSTGTNDKAARAHAQRNDDGVNEKLAAGYGVISGQDAVVWKDNKTRVTGSLLPTGMLQVAQGVVHLELFSGVSVIVEAPAEFAVNSPMQMEVRLGRVRAHVPEPAHGFRMATRDGEIVDLGTDFAVDVSSTRSELHVIEGEVELHAENKEIHRLEAGQAVSMSGEGLANLRADHERFLGEEEIASRLESTMKSRRQEWLKWSGQLQADPRLVALFQVGHDTDRIRASDRRLANRTKADSAASNGAIVAAARTPDRWLQRDGALDFSPTGSRVRLTIPGEYQSITLSCWVKINSLDRWYNSLFVTDGHEQHEPHWQIMDDGRLFFSVKKRDEWDESIGEKDKHIYYSPPFWSTSLSGQWLMISTVYDVESRFVTHFVNGEQISREAIPDDYLVERVRIGNATLCNWSLPERDEPRFAVRNLNGSLDEFAMFRAALSPEEIQEMYERGKP